MEAQQIRETFLDFFEKKNHRIIRSSSLLPRDDPTILFTNAGMNQFKDIFLGLEKRTYKRAASVQKCMRVSGKHNDLEQVGKTNKHHTFFEMLGNFSFGDYFKKEAVEFAWELITEVYRLEKQRLFITIYEEDEEAFALWHEGIGISSDRIFRFGKKHNYWAMGETGPCGPCSEIHYDLGSAVEKGKPSFLIERGSDRFLELWNLVFMQYHQDEKGELHPLPSPSIDTGMGLERLAICLQGKKSSFETDLFTPLIEAICDLAQQEYPSGKGADTAVRIIADHIRAITFLIGDGITPSNEGRGYVLRRLIRRAYRYGNHLGLEEPFLYKLAGTVTDIMKEAYPELLSSVNYISKLCLSEERRFALTLSSGLRTFHQYVEETKEEGKDILPGFMLFRLYDTFGFPLDLSRDLASEEGLGVDDEGFHQELEKQRQRARMSWRGKALQKGKRVYQKLKGLSVSFVGYEKQKIPEARVLAIIKDGNLVAELKEGEKGEIVLDKTPFYAEAGGQVGDAGILKNPRFSAVVESTLSPVPELITHKVDVLSGKIEVNDRVEASIDEALRNAISYNHTATHLLHASLRQILGDHVKQAGSLVSPTHLRFDFTHFSALSFQELKHVELLVNEKIRENIQVKTEITTLEKGLEAGAVAIFEEKYGEKVRMVIIDEFSKELCGGVHVRSTGEIGLFKIISESSVAAGMRRIEALTGEEALRYIQESEDLLDEIQEALSTSRKEILHQIHRLKERLRDKEKENRTLRQQMAMWSVKKEEEKIRTVKGIPVIVKKVKGLTEAEMRGMADSLRQKLGSGIVILATASDRKVFLVVSVSKDLTERFKANAFIKEIAPKIGGGGGGRQDFAQAGGTRPENLDQVLKNISAELERSIQ